MRKNTVLFLGLLAAALASPSGAIAQTNKLISWTNAWAYNDATDTTTPLAPGWELPGYNTNSEPGWKTGQALFGNDGAGVYNAAGSPFSGGINGFLTPLNRSVVAGDSTRVTFYFRTKFNWPGSPAGVILVSSNAVDDGMLVYLNGTEVLRKFISIPAPDPVTWDTLGQNHDPEGTIFTDSLPSASLVTGENTVAIELHQSSLNSSDVALALTLEGFYQFRPFFTDASQPTDRVVVQNLPTTLSVSASASPPISYQWSFQPGGVGPFNPITDETNASYTIALMAAGNAGSYFCTVTNPAGATNSRTATVGYTADGAPPALLRAIASATFDTVRVEFNELLDPVTAQDPSKYSFSGGLAISGAPVLSASGKSVLITLTTPMAPNTLYTVTANGVGDLALNYMLSANVQFRSWVPSAASGLVFEAFNGTPGPEIAGTITGTPVANLTSHPSYPSNASEVLLMPGLTTRLLVGAGYDFNTHENYGARIRGLFIPPESGNWTFILSSDDAGQLFLNPSGPQAAGKVLIAQQTGCCNLFPALGATISAPIPLVGGQAYYLEGLYKEGGGGDYFHVATVLGSEPIPTDGGDQGCLTCLDPSMVGSGALPAGAAGTNSITKHPTDATFPVNATATFSVGVTQQYGLPVLYQWRRDGVEIPLANNSSYSFIAALTDDLAVFSCAVTNLDGAGKISSNATLRVVVDDISPTVVSSTPAADGSGIVVAFNERMGASTAGVPGNYKINGVSAASATLSADLFSVTVGFTTPLPLCAANVLVITNAADLAGNVLTPNPTTIAFNTPLLLVPINATQVWRWESSGADLTAAGWQNPGYNDSAWPSGAGVLAFETGTNTPAAFPIRTWIADYVGARLTIYFRTHFNLATDPKSVTQLQLSEIIDDGSVVYLNGTEVHRLRVSAGALTYATGANAGGAEPHPLEGPFNLPTSALVYGDNVLAVAVLQSGTTSSDIVMGAQLLATAPACVSPLYVTHSGSNVTLTWPDPTFSLQTTTNLAGTWLPQAGTSPAVINSTSGIRYFRLIK